MPEGDSIRRIAAQLAPLVGEVVTASSPNPRGLVTGAAAAVDGRRLEGVDVSGKNLFLGFEGGVTIRSHLMMSGRWRVEPASAALFGNPWLVLVAGAWRAAQWNGPLLEVAPTGRFRRRDGADVLDDGITTGTIVARLRHADQARLLGEVLVDQRIVAGIGNLWLAELLWEIRTSPRTTVGAVSDETLGQGIDWVRGAMTASVSSRRPRARVYRRAGQPCPRCATTIVSFLHGEHARTMYVCPSCQALE